MFLNLLGLFAILAAVAVPILQSVEWLKSGVWPAAPISLVVESALVASTGWVGLDRIIAGTLDCHISGALLIIGSAFIWLENR